MKTQRSNTEVFETNSVEWVEWFKPNWSQGEHVAIIGPTGAGKSRISQKILDIREYVVVLAVKRFDDTLDRFKSGEKYGHEKYHVIKKWPPDAQFKRVILWVKPESLSDLREQAVKLHSSLERIYLSGGWCVYFDETGYIAGHLGLATQLGVLLNQGRSSHLSIVCSMTRPHSMVARIPPETLNQCRHILVFKYTDEREIKACAEICGISFPDMVQLMGELHTYSRGHTDYLYIGKGLILLVRNDT